LFYVTLPGANILFTLFQVLWHGEFIHHSPNFLYHHFNQTSTAYLQPDAIGKTLDHGSQVVLAFAHLAAKVKHRMTIIACTGYKSLCKPLRAAIAGVKDRHSRNMAQQSCLLWPHIRLQLVIKVLLCDMRASLRYNRDRRACIFVWEFGNVQMRHRLDTSLTPEGELVYAHIAENDFRAPPIKGGQAYPFGTGPAELSRWAREATFEDPEWEEELDSELMSEVVVG